MEDFTSGGFNLDLMDDDGPAFTSDPVFSSPQVSSPNSSHHSFDDALTPDSMDIVAWLYTSDATHGFNCECWNIAG